MERQHYESRIQSMVEPIVESEGFEVIAVECRRGKTRWLVRVYIDHDRGVTIDDCARISREVSDVMSVYDIPPGPYNLEISSPGLDRPLARDKDFIAYRGSTVIIRTRDGIDGRKNFKGRLVDYVDEGGAKILVVDVEGKQFRIPRDSIDKANLQYEL